MHSKIFEGNDSKPTGSVYSARRQEELVEELEGMIRMRLEEKDIQLPSAKDMKATQLAGHGLHDSQDEARGAACGDLNNAMPLRATENHVDGELRFAKDPLPLRVVKAGDHKQQDDGIPAEFWNLNAKLGHLDTRAEVEGSRTNAGSKGDGNRRAHSAMDAEARKRYQLSSGVFGAERRHDPSPNARTPRGDRDIVSTLEAGWTREATTPRVRRTSPVRAPTPQERKANLLGSSVDSPFANDSVSAPAPAGLGLSSRQAAKETMPQESGRRRFDRNFSDILGAEGTAEVRSNQSGRQGGRSDVLESPLTGPFDSRGEVALRRQQQIRTRRSSGGDRGYLPDDNAGAIVTQSPRGTVHTAPPLNEEAKRLRQEERAVTHAGKLFSSHGEIARLQHENMVKKTGLGTMSPRNQTLLPADQRKRQEMASKAIKLVTGAPEAPHDDGRGAPPLRDITLPMRVRSGSASPRGGYNSARQTYMESVLASSEF